MTAFPGKPPAQPSRAAGEPARSCLSLYVLLGSSRQPRPAAWIGPPPRRRPRGLDPRGQLGVSRASTWGWRTGPVRRSGGLVQRGQMKDRID